MGKIADKAPVVMRFPTEQVAWFPVLIKAPASRNVHAEWLTWNADNIQGRFICVSVGESLKENSYIAVRDENGKTCQAPMGGQMLILFENETDAVMFRLRWA